MCVKNIRFGRVNQRKAQNKSVLGLGDRKVGRRIAAGFISLITPVVKIIVQFAELFPPGEGTLEFMTAQWKYCQIYAILNLSIMGWRNCSSSICSPGFLISPHIHSWGNTVVYNALPHMQYFGIQSACHSPLPMTPHITSNVNSAIACKVLCVLSLPISPYITLPTPLPTMAILLLQEYK